MSGWALFQFWVYILHNLTFMCVKLKYYESNTCKYSGRENRVVHTEQILDGAEGQLEPEAHVFIIHNPLASYTIHVLYRLWGDPFTVWLHCKWWGMKYFGTKTHLKLRLIRLLQFETNKVSIFILAAATGNCDTTPHALPKTERASVILTLRE